MSAYMDQKVIHKYITYTNREKIRSIRTACHIENKTWAYKANYQWATVTCQNCLRKK